MSEQTPADAAAAAIIYRLGQEHPAIHQPQHIKMAVEEITRHLGDGRDKERMDWLDGQYFSVEGWLKFHGEPNLRSAIDAERNTERNAKRE